ncbi:predicted protein [Streptomyces sp. C]|nr:predicted protein [Streptomyces sp. C]
MSLPPLGCGVMDTPRAAAYRPDPEFDSTKGVLEAYWPDPDHIRIIDLDHGHHDLRIAPDGRPPVRLAW